MSEYYKHVIEANTILVDALSNAIKNDVGEIKGKTYFLDGKALFEIRRFHNLYFVENMLVSQYELKDLFFDKLNQ